MDFFTAAVVYTGTMVFGFLATQIYGWYQERKQADALLIDVACQTEPLKKINLRSYVKSVEEFDDKMSTDSDSDSISSYFISNS